jgi:hypothetical protein
VLTNPDYPQTGSIPSPNTNFGPRVGLAYSFNNAKTVLRAGYGMYYARFTGAVLNTIFTQNGVYQKNVSLSKSVASELAAGPVFPNRLTNMDKNPPAGSLTLTFPGDGFRNPYSEQGDIGIEHQLTTNLGLTVSYIWSRGLHLTVARDLNIGELGPDVTYRIGDVNGTQVGTYTTPTYLLANRVDKRYQRLNSLESNGNSYYNAMTVQLRKRMSKGLQASVVYTWSHAIDFAQGGGDRNTFYTSGFPSTVFNGDYTGEKGSSDLDQRHRLMVNFVYSPTFTTSDTVVARYLINNWQLSALNTFASAQPATATVSVTGTPFTGAAFNYSLNGFGGSSRVPFWPLNSLDIDQIARTDVRLSKVLPFSERFKAFVSFEAFNVFGNVSNTGVKTRAYSARNGLLTLAPDFGQGSISGGFPDGTNARRAQLSMRLVF